MVLLIVADALKKEIVRFTNKDTLESLLDFAFGYVNLGSVLSNIHDSFSTKSDDETHHIRTMLNIKVTQTYCMFAEQLIGWLKAIKEWISSDKSKTILKTMYKMEVYGDEIQKFKEEFLDSTRKDAFLNSFIFNVDTANEPAVKKALENHFTNMFKGIHFNSTSSIGKILKKIYNKTKHGLIVLHHIDWKEAIVPDDVTDISKDESDVTALFIIGKKDWAEYLNLSMAVSVPAFIQIIAIIYRQLYSELPKQWADAMKSVPQTEKNVQIKFYNLMKKIHEKGFE